MPLGNMAILPRRSVWPKPEKAALAARTLVIEGVHPVHNRQTVRLATHAENANTFEAVTNEWIEKTKAGSPVYYRQ